MSMYGQERGPDETPDGGMEESFIAVPSSSNEQPMTMRELREAAEDESHPRHAEAVQRNKELADQLRPAMDRLRKTMTSSVPQIMPKVDFAKLDLPETGFTKFDSSMPITEQHQRWHSSIREQHEELQEILDASARARAERQEMKDKQTQQTLAVLASVDAHLALLNSRIKDVGARIEAGNTSSSKMAKWTIAVAVLTLLTTIAGIVVTVI